MRFSVTALLLGLVATGTARQQLPRRPDSEWDFIIKGSDVQKRSSEADGSSKEAHPSYISNYQMRARIVDPSSLKVDTVKQYSGYLDDTANGKHLFFCTL